MLDYVANNLLIEKEEKKDQKEILRNYQEKMREQGRNNQKEGNKHV